MIKYIAAASGGVNVILGLGCYFLLSSLNSTKDDLGEVRAIAASNKSVADNNRNLYGVCQTEKKDLITGHNDQIASLYSISEQQTAATREAIGYATSSTARLDSRVRALVPPAAGGKCEDRLDNVSSYLDSYRGAVKND